MIRKATIDDISAIADLYSEQFSEMAKMIPDFIKEGEQDKEFIEKTILAFDSDVLLYEHENIIVGFILLQKKQRPDFSFMVRGKFCYIMDLLVTENQRKKGFGTSLMYAAKDWAKEKDCDFVTLDVLSANKGAISLYEKLGFIPKSQEMYIKLK